MKEGKKWSVARARQRFADLLETCVREPQPIYKHNRLVAVMVDAETFEKFLRWREEQAGRSVADAFAELRAACRKEGVNIRWPRRKNRPAGFPAGKP